MVSRVKIAIWVDLGPGKILTAPKDVVRKASLGIGFSRIVGSADARFAKRYG